MMKAGELLFLKMVKDLFTEVMPVDMIICIAVNYFLITAIPTYALAEIGVRGSVAAAVFGVYGIEALPVISASLIIWIVNLAIPSLIRVVLPLPGGPQIPSTLPLDSGLRIC